MEFHISENEQTELQTSIEMNLNKHNTKQNQVAGEYIQTFKNRQS